MIHSNGYLLENTVIWELEDDQFDFSQTEFDDLIFYIKTGSLFVYLEKNRLALKDQLILIKENLYPGDDMEVEEWEHMLETLLRNLNLRLRR